MEQRKSILITGASTGIGYHCAKILHKKGWQVIASCRSLADVSRLQAEGLTCIQLDVKDSDSIHKAVEETLTLTNDNLYALFNNAGYGQPGAVEDLTRKALRAQFETNFFGLCELTNAVLPIMHRQGYGRIIQNSSILGFAAMPMRGAYNASKFAIEGITDTLRLELKGSNIFVSLIEPGPILSDFRQNALKQLQDNIDYSKSRFGFQYVAASHRLGKKGPAVRFTLGPEAVCKKLEHALTSSKPKARYYVTFPTYLLGYLKRFLSTSMMDKILGKVN